jgi:hypothetical protein
MTGAPSAPRGSVVATLRLLASGREGSVVTSVVMTIVCAGWLAWWTPRYMFAQTLVMLLSCLAAPTAILEATIADRLGFLSIVPQPVPARWLLLAPMCGLGLLYSVASVVAGRGPAAAVIAAFGCACWIVGATRWLRRIPYWPFAVPLVPAVPVAAAFVLRAFGWGATTVMSAALGLAAIAFQPRAWLGAGSEARTPRGRTPVAARPGVARQAVSTSGRDGEGWLATTARFMRLVCTPTVRLDQFMVPFAVLFILLFQYPGSSLFIVVFGVPAYVISVAFSSEAHEFFEPLPLSGTQRWVGGLAYPLLVTFGLLLLMLPCLSLEWMNGGGLPGRLIKHTVFGRPSTGYLRDVLGATFLPEKWPAGGLSPEQWSRVRPLLWLDLLRTALFTVASLFVRATFPLPGDDKTRTPIPRVDLVLFLLIGVCVMLFSTHRLFVNWLPSWWFAAILAAVAVARWLWKVRGAPATGSSTPG